MNRYLPLIAAFLFLAALTACEEYARTGTLEAKVDNLPETSRIRIENTTGRDWVDVTFTLNKLYTYEHKRVPAGSVIEIGYKEFTDENGESYDPDKTEIFRLWIATPDEYWGL